MTIDERDKKKHPMQPLGLDETGVLRFKENKIVSALLETSTLDLNEIALGVIQGKFSVEDQVQLAQLIGYSHEGFGSLSYASNQTYTVARTMYHDGRSELEARLDYFEGLISMLRDVLREPMAELYEVHPDALGD